MKNGKESLVYIASPYTHPHRWVRNRRFDAALSALRFLLKRGIVAFSPVVHTHYLGIEDFETEDWLRVDRPILAASSAVYVLCIEGWNRSVGVSWEIDYAKSNGLDLKYMVYDGDWRIQDEPGEAVPVEDFSLRPSMSFVEYQRCCADTAIYPSIGDKTTYPLLGLAGEVGELLNKVKKFWRDGNGALADMDESRRRSLTSEIGDILWYVAQTASEFGIDVSEAASVNIMKLRDRKERGCLTGSGDCR